MFNESWDIAEAKEASKVENPPNPAAHEEEEAARKWALECGLPGASERGRVPLSIIEKYRETRS